MYESLENFAPCYPLPGKKKTSCQCPGPNKVVNPTTPLPKTDPENVKKLRWSRRIPWMISLGIEKWMVG